MSFEKDYWELRYKGDGTSGVGSYGQYFKFKSTILNQFILDKNIKNIFDYGCGDCNQLAGLNLNNVIYYGSDISDFIIEKHKKIYEGSNFNFIYDNEIDNQGKFELVLSLDVIYHIVTDENYYQYIKNIKKLSDKYIIIYSSNDDSIESLVHHVKHRSFLNDILDGGEFELINIIRNIHDVSADFYFFKRVCY